jgi:hypothetical protein
MKRMIASGLADSPASFFSTTNDRYNKTQIAFGKTAHSETSYNSGALWVALGYACDCEKAIPPHFDANALSGDPTKTSMYGYYGIPSTAHQSVTHHDRYLRLEAVQTGEKRGGRAGKRRSSRRKMKVRSVARGRIGFETRERGNDAHSRRRSTLAYEADDNE